MSTSEINRLLGLLDDWVQALEESRLSEACREEGRDFFRFMQARGVNAALMAKLIIDTTGYNPSSTLARGKTPRCSGTLSFDTPVRSW